eukprot:1157790-Pelagomonas_calceolata.AAC.5
MQDPGWQSLATPIVLTTSGGSFDKFFCSPCMGLTSGVGAQRGSLQTRKGYLPLQECAGYCKAYPILMPPLSWPSPGNWLSIYKEQCYHGIMVKAPCAYLYLDMADVTSNLGANCAAILAQGPTRGPEALTTSEGLSLAARNLWCFRLFGKLLGAPTSISACSISAQFAPTFLYAPLLTTLVGLRPAGPELGPSNALHVFSKHWIRDSSIVLVQQEAQPSFRTRAIACLGNAAPLLLGSSPTSNGTMANGADDPWARSKTGASARGGTRVLLLVRGGGG